MAEDITNLMYYAVLGLICLLAIAIFLGMNDSTMSFMGQIAQIAKAITINQMG